MPAAAGWSGEEDAGDTRVDPRLEEGKPQAKAEHKVDQRGADPRPTSDQESDKDHTADRQMAYVDAAGVEDGDHQHGHDVVDDGQRRQEDPQREGTRLPRSASSPRAKAGSVAIGTPQPAAPGPEALKPR